MNAKNLKNWCRDGSMERGQDVQRISPSLQRFNGVENNVDELGYAGCGYISIRSSAILKLGFCGFEINTPAS